MVLSTFRWQETRFLRRVCTLYSLVRASSLSQDKFTIRKRARPALFQWTVNSFVVFPTHCPTERYDRPRSFDASIRTAPLYHAVQEEAMSRKQSLVAFFSCRSLHCSAALAVLLKLLSSYSELESPACPVPHLRQDLILYKQCHFSTCLNENCAPAGSNFRLPQGLFIRTEIFYRFDLQVVHLAVQWSA